MLDFSELKKQFNCCGAEFSENELLSRHSTFKIGGPAKLIVSPNNTDQFIDVLNIIRKSDQRYIVIGKGSNVLFDDKGYDGVIVSTHNMRSISIHDNILEADCGASFTKMASEAADNGLSGLEFAYGIPGSCGGAVFMNAGAYGSDTSCVILQATCFDMNSGNIVRLACDEMAMSYRHSLFMHRPELVILSASFGLEQGDEKCIKDSMDYNMAQRRQKQPLEYPNAGSTFKRHDGYFIGKIIEDCGLKGYCIGGAQVSEKHAGFIVNRGEATSDEVIELISYIKKIILEKYGFELTCEIRYIR